MATAARVDGQEKVMPSAARVDGQEKVIAAAQQIVKSLATSQNAAEDMIRILSGFDDRLSTINDLFPSSEDQSRRGGPLDEDENDGEGEVEEQQSAEPPSEGELRLEAAERVVLRWDSSDSLLFESSPEDSAEYLSAVDELIALASVDPDDDDGDGEAGALRGRAESAVQMAMARLEDEFRHLMIRNTVPLDAAALSCPVSSRHYFVAHLDSLAAASASTRTSLSFASVAPDDLDSSADDDHNHHNQANEASLDYPSGSSLTVSAALDEEEEEEKQQLSLMIDLVHPEAVADLHAIADRMIAAGYGSELLQAYSGVRRDVLDECLSIIGVDRISIEEVQRIEWSNLDDRMRRWNSAVEVVVRVLLAGEHRLCDQVVAGADPNLATECFVEAARGCVMQLLNFGDAIAVCRRSTEKLFRILGMYEALADVMPDLEAMFPGDAGQFIIGEAEGILRRLGEAARGTFDEFENAIRGEASRKPMQNGEIHPITRYVMNYLKLLVCYRDSLDSLLDDGGADGGDHSGGGSENNDGQNLGSMTTLGHRLLHLMSHLESNIEEKSKLYEDGGMQYIFLMNNMLYIVQKVKDSELRAILGDHWIRRHRGQIRQYATSYLRVSWTKVLSYLRDDGLGGSGSGSSNNVSRVALKERFKSFNLAFEEIYRIQTSWKVPDPQLRDELRISVSEKVIPAYRAFVGRFRGHLEGGRKAAKYIKYTPEDLENHLLDLFEGLPGLPNHPRRKISS